MKEAVRVIATVERPLFVSFGSRSAGTCAGANVEVLAFFQTKPTKGTTTRFNSLRLYSAAESARLPLEAALSNLKGRGYVMVNSMRREDAGCNYLFLIDVLSIGFVHTCDKNQ